MPTALVEELLRCHPDSLILTKNNPRGKINTKAADFQELVESVRVQGVRMPVHGRPHPTREDCFEIHAGARRILAARKVGLQSVPLICHHKMSDDDAMQITIIENFARKRLTPIEEGRGVAKLLAIHNDDVAAVASRLGRSPRWVRARAKLRDLLPKFLDAMEAGSSSFRKWTGAHLELVARFPKDTQEQIFQALTLQFFPDTTIKDLDKWLNANFLRLLRKAPWKLDAELADAPTCAKCPKRSSAQGILFHDDAPTAKDDKCLDPDCWQRKAEAFLNTKYAKLLAEHGDAVVPILNGSPGYEEGKALSGLFPGVVPRHQYDKCKKGSPGARAGLVVFGPGSGGLRWVQVTGTSSTGLPSKRTGPTSLAERRAGLESKRLGHVLTALIDKMESRTNNADMADDALIAFVATFGTAHRLDTNWAQNPYTDDDDMSSHWVTFDLLRKDPQLAREYLQRQVVATIANRLVNNGPSTSIPKTFIDEAERVAKDAMGIDIGPLKEAAVLAIPEPKSWAKLAADGTPKKAAAKKPAKTKAKTKPTPGVCRGCGCTNSAACEGGCEWVEPDLCSACVQDGTTNEAGGFETGIHVIHVPIAKRHEVNISIHVARRDHRWYSSSSLQVLATAPDGDQSHTGLSIHNPSCQTCADAIWQELVCAVAFFDVKGKSKAIAPRFRAGLKAVNDFADKIGPPETRP